MEKERGFWQALGRNLAESLVFAVLIFCIWWLLLGLGVLEPVREIKLNGWAFKVPFVFSRWADFAAICLFWLVPLSLLSDCYKKLSEEAGLVNIGMVVGGVAAVFFGIVYFLIDNSFLVIFSVSVFLSFLFSFLSYLIHERPPSYWRMNLGYSVVLMIVPGFCFGFLFMFVFFAASWISFFLGAFLGLVIRVFQALYYRISYGKNWRSFLPLSWRL